MYLHTLSISPFETENAEQLVQLYERVLDCQKNLPLHNSFLFMNVSEALAIKSANDFSLIDGSRETCDILFDAFTMLFDNTWKPVLCSKNKMCIKVIVIYIHIFSFFKINNVTFQ